MDDLARFAARTDLAPVVHAAIAHARFEVTHPFVDGNGRVGRTFLQHLLVARLDPAAPVPVSIPWSWYTDEDIDGLRSYQDGELDPWIEFAAGSFARIHRTANDIENLLRSFKAQTETRGRSVAARVIDDFPPTTTRRRPHRGASATR